MRKIALALIAVGFVFTFVALPFMGVDLLIDAVGFLLVWNGLRALQKQDALYGFAPVLALALVPVSALQLFFTGPVATALAVLRFAAEMLLYWQMFRGFVRFYSGGGRRLFVNLAWVGMAFCLMGTLAALVGLLPFAAGAGFILSGFDILPLAGALIPLLFYLLNAKS